MFQKRGVGTYIGSKKSVDMTFNFGFEKINNSYNQYPILAGIGASLSIVPLKTIINTD